MSEALGAVALALSAGFTLARVTLFVRSARPPKTSSKLLLAPGLVLPPRIGAAASAQAHGCYGSGRRRRAAAARRRRRVSRAAVCDKAAAAPGSVAKGAGGMRSGGGRGN